MGRDRRPRRSRGRGRWRARDGEPPIRRIAAHAGTITDLAGRPQKVNRAAPNAPSVVYDAVVVLGGTSAAVLAESGLAIHFVNEAYRHGKPIAAVGNGALLLDVCSLGEANAKEGLVIGDDAEAVRDLITALLQHRFPADPLHASRSELKKNRVPRRRRMGKILEALVEPFAACFVGGLYPAAHTRKAASLRY